MKDYLYELIPNDRYITKSELMDLTGLDERTVRRLIAQIRQDHNIISLSSRKGYMKAKHTDDMTQEEIQEMYNTVKHQIAESNSRIKKLKYNMKEQISYLKVLEKNII